MVFRARVLKWWDCVLSCTDRGDSGEDTKRAISVQPAWNQCQYYDVWFRITLLLDRRVRPNDNLISQLFIFFQPFCFGLCFLFQDIFFCDINKSFFFFLLIVLICSYQSEPLLVCVRCNVTSTITADVILHMSYAGFSSHFCWFARTKLCWSKKNRTDSHFLSRCEKLATFACEIIFGPMQHLWHSLVSEKPPFQTLILG